jgi:protein involved in polysaccharide export with SLBB domain
MKSDKTALRRFLAVLTVVSLASSFSRAQVDRSTYDLMGESERPDLTGTYQPGRMALESTIDPERYFVGPSDVFSVNIWTSPPLGFTLTVTPEGSLIIPTIGEVRVSDLTLREAKAMVLRKIGTKYRTDAESASVTLISPRPIVVWVRGNVLNPGSYELWAFNRADKAIEEANKLQITQEQRDLVRVLETMSTRNVTVRHKDGTMSRVDIAKFMSTKDDKWNPHLREGDVVIVPRKDPDRSVVAVYGEVNVPGRFEYVKGDSIKDVLHLAQGFTPHAIVDSLEFFRVPVGSDSMRSVIFDGEAMLDGRVADVALEPGDRILVRARSDIRADYYVEVVGEVVSPGIYPITRDRTHLSEILKKCGGFTRFASVKTAELVRQSVRPEDVDLERLLSLRGGVSAEDSLYYYQETNLRIRKEIVNISFEKLVLEADSTQDVLLQHRDIIRVPSEKVTIYVFGQVTSPGHIPFTPGAGVGYYIRQAGGYTDRARPEDVRVVKAKTRQWISVEEAVVEEGDYVWVPKEVDRSFGYYMAIIGQTAAIVSVALSIIILATQIGN